MKLVAEVHKDIAELRKQAMILMHRLSMENMGRICSIIVLLSENWLFFLQLKILKI